MNNRKRMQMVSLLVGVLAIFAMIATMLVFAQQYATAGVMDATPPTIEFIEPTPENDSTVTVNYVNVTASVTDPSGVSSVLLNWNGGNETMDMIGPSNFSMNKTNLPIGVYTYKVYANDIYGNWGVSETRVVKVNVTNPDLVITNTWVCWPHNCTICYNVTNIGNGTAPAGHTTTLFVDGVEVTHDLMPVVLASGDSYIGCFNYTWTYTPPSDIITVCADNNNTVEESNETNNCMTNIWMCGDVTGDNKVRTSDGRRIFHNLTYGVPIDNLWAADVTGDGRVRTSDGRRIFHNLTYGVPLNCTCCE